MAGGYSQVYRATIDGVTEVAVKIFHDVHSQLQQADILREVAILKGCRQASNIPNLGPILTVCLAYYVALKAWHSCRDRNIVQFLGAAIMVRFFLTPCITSSTLDSLPAFGPKSLKLGMASCRLNLKWGPAAIMTNT